MLKRYASMLAVFTAISLLPFSASAMTVRGGDQYALPTAETVSDDLYAGGATLIINGNVNGDFIGGGGNITINGTISQDATIAGGNISLLGDVGDDVRMAGGNAIIGKSIKGDVLFAGGTLYILKDAVINGDIALAGGSIVIDGTVKGKSKISADSITINGTLAGEVEIISGTQLHFGANANVPQTIKHQGSVEATIDQGAHVGKIDFTKLQDSSGHAKGVDNSNVAAVFAGIFGLIFLIKLISLLVVALIAVNWMKPLTTRLAEESLEEPLSKVLRGFAWLILVPIALIISLITIIGSGITMVLGPVYMLSIAMAQVLAGIVLGVWILRLSSKNKVAVDWKPAVLGVIALEILSVIPIIGWLLALWVFLMALGSIYTYFSQRLKTMK